MTRALEVNQVGKLYRKRPTALGRQLLDLARGRRAPEIWALRDISFALDQGEALGILGQNGAGKSTLLKLITQIARPTRGRIAARGRIASLLELGAGFHPELTGRDNIFINGALLGLRRRQIQERFDQIVAFSELEDFIDMPVKWYSSGMYVRLGFAVAVHVDADFLIIDEVLSVGDAAFRIKCFNKVDELRRQGITMCYVSHDLWTIEKMCSRAILLEEGRLVEDTSPSQAIRRYHQLNLNKESEQGSTDFFVVEDLELRTAADQPLISLEDGEGIRVRIRYRTEKAVEPTFVVRIYTADHLLCATIADIYLPPYTISGQGERRVALGALALTPGRYYLKLEIVDRHLPIVYAQKASAAFDVGTPEGETPSQKGILKVGAEWD